MLFDTSDIKVSKKISSTTSEAFKHKQLSEIAKKSQIFLDEVHVRFCSVKRQTMETIGLNQTFRLPERGEQVRIRTQKKINPLIILLLIVKKHGVIDDLVIATYSFNKEALDVIQDLVVGGKIKKLRMILCRSISFRKPEQFANIKKSAVEMSLKFNVHLCFADLHFKITTVRCGVADYYQLEGSMNYTSNSMAEQILVENNKQSYDYDYEFLTKTVIENATEKALEIIC